MPRNTPRAIKQRARIWHEEGLTRDLIVQKVEETFDKRGNLKKDANSEGAGLSEKTVSRWIKDEGWTDWDAVDDLPLTTMPDPDADVSKIKDAVLHFAMIAADKAVAEKDAKSRRIKATIQDVLIEVHSQQKPGGRVLKYLADTYLPQYIRRFRRHRGWEYISLEDEATIAEIMKEVPDEE